MQFYVGGEPGFGRRSAGRVAVIVSNGLVVS